MRKIVLICTAGMSTSLLVTKIREAAKEEGYDCDVNAFPQAEAAAAVKDADLVLLGPQIRFQLDKIRSIADCPVEAINMTDYGRMDGEAVLEFAQEVLGD